MVKETTKIKLYSKSPFRSDYANVIHFDNRDEMQRYFDTDSPHLKKIYESDNFQFISRTGEIYVSGRQEQFETATYMFFKNAGKEYYAFVYDIAYINENTTKIIYELDIWNTYQPMLFNKNTQVSGTIAQYLPYLPSDDKNFRARHTNTQGFNVGSKATEEIYDVGANLVDWLVIVAKPEFKFKGEAGTPASDMSFSGTQKSLKYYFVPVEIAGKMTKQFELDGQTYPPKPIVTILLECFGITVGGKHISPTKDNTADAQHIATNNIVNMYYSRYLGIDYDYDGSVVKIKKADGDIFNVVGVGRQSSAAPSGGSGDLVTVGGPTGSEKEIAERIAKTIKANYPPATVNGIAALLGNAKQESSMDYTIDVAAGLGLWQWTSTRAQGLRNYAHSKGISEHTIEAQVGWLLNEPGESETAKAVLSGNDSAGNLSDIFVTRWERAGIPVADKRRAYAESFVPVVKAVINDAGNNANAGKNADNKTTSAPKPAEVTEKVIAKVKAMANKSVGNGQCYALSSYYCQCFRELGVDAPGLGAGVGNLYKQIGDTYNAYAIGSAYDWKSCGWGVKFNPSEEDFKNAAGCMINYKPNYGPTVTGGAGHTGICISYDGHSLHTVEQNYGNNGYTLDHVVTHVHADALSSIVIPPDVLAGGKINPDVVGDASGGDGSGGANSAAYIVKIVEHPKAAPKFIEIDELKPKILKRLKAYVKDTLGERFVPMVNQLLLISELIDVELYDYYGNTYAYQLELLNNLQTEDGKYYNKSAIMLLGSVGDQNYNFAGLVAYGHTHNIVDQNNKTFKIKAKADENIISKWDIMQYGIFDTTGKNLTILDDATATYIQGHAAQIKAQQASFNENASLQRQQADMNNRQTSFANDKNIYGANFAVDQSVFKRGKAGVMATVDVATNALDIFSPLKKDETYLGKFMSTAGNTAKAGMNGYYNVQQSLMDVTNAKVNRSFAQDENELRSQSTALANLQAKTAIDQQIRAFNATMTDLQNQPDSIQQMGNDISFQTSNYQQGLFIRIRFPYPEQLKTVLTYMHLYGYIYQTESNDVLKYAYNRQAFNYIKLTSADVSGLEAPQSDLAMIKNILASGVRIWEAKYLDYTKPKPFDIYTPNPNRADDQAVLDSYRNFD